MFVVAMKCCDISLLLTTRSSFELFSAWGEGGTVIVKDVQRRRKREGVIGRVGRSEDSSSSDVIGEDFVNPLNRKPSLIPAQIHASLSLPKIKGNNTGTEIGCFHSPLPHT